jgi:hypothetical protein
MMNDDEEPKLWVKVTKRVIGAIVMIALVGLGLYYSAKFKTYAPPEDSGPDTSWGIVNDSPIRYRR